MTAAVIGLGGLAARLTRLGVWSSVTGARLADHHGTLVLGFVGILAALEAAKARWGYAAPEDIALWWVAFVVLLLVGAIEHALHDDERAF
ncbi:MULTISPECIES: hypothetical protein [unclassified Actinobaculum]|uniref:hypothetical protein n=1 Tax=unclassified Actinobaculum TaxID=2609299 RepID=UPI000D525D93|nr:MULTISPECIES: hypothetical protein [unclassified Actinobaculum]AWE42265.1 hypothetical protein DDD63_05340 [Actinobaculum sp. 313]RTE50833.1 hypothetical protein EKN07_01495 [Actinobaculum sp. 352]